MDPFQPAAIVMVPSGDGRWLTVTRPEWPHEAALPGGLIELGETSKDAAARELWEETGICAMELERVGIGKESGRRVDVFFAKRWSGRPQSKEARTGPGMRASWMTFPELRRQAVKFGGFLDGLANGFRARYGTDP